MTVELPRIKILPSKLFDPTQNLEHELKNLEDQTYQRSEIYPFGDVISLLFFARKMIFAFRHRTTPFEGRSFTPSSLPCWKAVE